MSKLSDALERIQELEDEQGAADVTAVEVECAHVVTTWIDYDGGRVGLDAAGSMVRVELEPSIYGRSAERY